MTAPRRRRGRRRDRRLPAWVLTCFLVAGAFAAGLALGEALNDNPRPGGTQTIVRTFKP